MRRLLLLILLAAAALPLSAANFSGEWVLQVPRPGRGGQMQSLYLSLNHNGNQVSGHLRVSASPSTGAPSNTEIWDAKVEGNTITFYVWSGQDKPAKVFYKGVLSGEEIQFTIEGGPPGYNVRGELNPPAPPRKGVARRAP